MNSKFVAENYEMKRIKNASYNGAKLRITDVKRTDGEMISRKEITNICDGFLTELRNKYSDVDGYGMWVFHLSTPIAGIVPTYQN